jgi:hypothetical protein
MFTYQRTEAQLGTVGVEVDSYGVTGKYMNLYHWQVFPTRLLTKNAKIKICKTIILPVVLYRYETWSVKLREEYRLLVSEKRVKVKIKLSL